MVATLLRPDELTRVRAHEVAELEARWPELIAWFAAGAHPNDPAMADVPRLAMERYVDLAA